MIHPHSSTLEFRSEKFHEDLLYIWQYYNDIGVERVGSILHIGLRYNESLKEITPQADQSQLIEGICSNSVRFEKQMSSYKEVESRIRVGILV